MVETLVVKAPAKINLGLEVIGKRADGYHDIVTIFQEIALADELELTLNEEGITFSVDDPSLPTDAENLAYRAASLFFENYSKKCGVEIKLIKKIPHQAGLGGGSSDAAAVLKGLNQLCNKPYSADDLAQIALKLGSDVPFFLRGGTAYATGRGEILEFFSLSDWRAGVVLLKPRSEERRVGKECRSRWSP